MSLDLILVNEYLKEVPFQEVNQISFKVISPEHTQKFNFQTSLMPRINSRDPQIKDLKIQVGSVIATYRDYELNVTPYYAFRVVVL